jgi:hypothetical protein
MYYDLEAAISHIHMGLVRALRDQLPTEYDGLTDLYAIGQRIAKEMVK